MKRQTLPLLKQGNSMKQILYQAKRTEPAAHKAPQNASEHKEKPQNPERNLDAPLIQHRLECPDGTGADGTRTGIAVQSRYTGIFQVPLIDFPVQKPVDIPVGKNSIENLYLKP